MARTGVRDDPFVAFRFEVKVGDFAVAGFSECTGLTIETDVHDYQEGGENTYVHRFPTRTKYVNLVLKRGIVDRTLFDWYIALTRGDVRRHRVTITMRDPAGSSDPVAEWELQRAFPVKWQGPDLNATQNTIAVETLDLAHDGLIQRTK